MGSNKHWSAEEIEFVKNNSNLTPEELSKKINRTAGAIWRKANIDGITLAYNQYHWNDKSVDILVQNYDKLTLNAIADILGTTMGSVKMKASTLKLKKQEQSIWSESEVNFLKENYSKLSYKELSKQLNKDTRSIGWQMRKYGLERVSREKWSLDEEKFILENKGLTYKDVAQKLNRPIGSIKKKAQKLGASLASEYFIWTDDKIEELRKLYLDDMLPSSAIAEKLNTTKQSVEMKIFKMGFKKDIYVEWSDNDLEYLKNHYKDEGKTYEQIGKDLGRTREAVRSKFRELDLGCKDDRKRWADDEIETLKIHAPVMDSKELSGKLDRDRDLVLRKAREIGVKIKNYYFEWNEKTEQMLKDNYLVLDNNKLASKLKTTNASVKHRLIKLGLTRPVFGWNETKDNYLCDNFKDSNYESIASELGITRLMVKHRLKKLNLKKNVWEVWQDDFLVKNVNKLSNKDLSEKLNKSELSVTSRIHEKRLNRKEKEPEWSNVELEYLKANYASKTYYEVGFDINRSKMAVTHKAAELGLIKQLKWSESDIEYLKDNYKGSDIILLANKLNRTESSIKRMSSTLGLFKDRPYTIPERTVGLILINLLGQSKVKAQYNEGVEVPDKVWFPHPVILRVEENEVTSTYMKPDYELYHEESKTWIPSEYFGFTGEMYELRKRIKKAYFKRKYGNRFVSFNVEDLRSMDLIKLKLQKSGYL